MPWRAAHRASAAPWAIPTDKDYFALSLNANETLQIGMTGPASTDYDLYLVDASDATLASSTSGTSTESISYTNGTTARTVYAKVISYSGSSTTSPYTLSLTYTAGSSVTELIGNGGLRAAPRVDGLQRGDRQLHHTDGPRRQLEGLAQRLAAPTPTRCTRR